MHVLKLIHASEVAKEMLVSPNVGRCNDDLLPQMHIIDDRSDTKDNLHCSQHMVEECCVLVASISARHL